MKRTFVLFLFQELRDNPIVVGEGCAVEIEIETQGDGKVRPIIFEDHFICVRKIYINLNPLHVYRSGRWLLESTMGK